MAIDLNRANPLTEAAIGAAIKVHRALGPGLLESVYLVYYSGQWAYRVRVQAKSGVSGGVMAVVNRQLGIATYSQRLDRRGNSCREIEVCVELAARLGLHAFDCLNVGSSFLSVVL